MRINLLKCALCFLLIFTSLATDAAVKLSPLNCKLEQTKVTASTIYFNINNKKNHSKIYFIQNESTDTILLDHRKQNVGASAGWASTLSPGNWSAISIIEKNFAMQCSKTVNNKFMPTDCRQLKVCQSATSLRLKSKGSYWLVEDKSREELEAALVERLQ